MLGKAPRRRPLAIISAALAALYCLPPAKAQQSPVNGTVRIQASEIHLDGAITPAVASEFERVLRANPGAKAVSLNSPGGGVLPALQIARTVKAAGLSTSVLSGRQCYSACSLIFLAGPVRIAMGKLGVHQISGVNDPSLTQTVIGKIYEDLVGFNTPSYLVSRMLRTPPSDMYIFAPEELERHKINIRSKADAASIPHLQVVEGRVHDDWLAATFLNTRINKPFVALESHNMAPTMRIAHYPHRAGTFVEFMFPQGGLVGSKSRLELRFSRGQGDPITLTVDADIEPNAYAFDLPADPSQAEIFWALFTTSTGLTVVSGSGSAIGRYGLRGSDKAVNDYTAMATRSRRDN